MESICQLTAHWFDQAKVPWDSYPFNPNTKCVTDMEHFEFALKACPFAWYRAHIDEQQTRVREILKHWQGGDVVIPTPTPKPPPVTEWPNGWTTAQLSKQFGRVTEIAVSKSNVVTASTPRAFDAKGVLSNMWVARAVAEGITDVTRIPKPSHFTVTRAKDDTGCSVFVVPRSGYRDWIGFRGDGNASWVWVQ